MKIERKEALKSLWTAIEDTIKALKTLSENPVVSSSLSNLWDSFSIYQSSIRALLNNGNVTPGKFYKITEYDKNYIIFKVEYYDTMDRDGIGLKVKVLTASNKRFNYNDVKNDMTLSVSELNKNNDSVEEIEIIPENLPLYIGNEFLGTLFKELMTKAGLPIPPEPEPKPEEEE